MSKWQPSETSEPKPYAAIKKYRDGGEAVIEFFRTEKNALLWIARQPDPWPTNDEWEWYIGRFENREAPPEEQT